MFVYLIEYSYIATFSYFSSIRVICNVISIGIFSVISNQSIDFGLTVCALVTNIRKLISSKVTLQL